MPKKRKTVSQLKLSGSYRASRHGDRSDEVDMDLAAAPPKPNFLTGAGSSEWDRLSVLLVERGVLSVFDLAILTQYCVHWQVLCDHHENGSEEQLTGAFHNNLRTICNELGLTPASRSKVPSLKIEKQGSNNASLFDGSM